MLDNALIEVQDLHTYFHTEDGIVRAVDGVSFKVYPRKVLGVVGESGCGKSITALSIMQLIAPPHGRIESGQILYDRGAEKGGVIDIVKQDPRGKVMRSIRGNEIAMIFQEPMTSLNPVYTVGEQIVEAVMLHQKVTRSEAWSRAIEMLDRVGIPSPEQRVNEFPHQMSGGMRQRAMIAMALSCNPLFLIADEPTTALDVTIQAQILSLMKKLQERYQMAIMMITHNMGVVAKMCDDIVVMYMGRVVEQAPVVELFKNPLHPYTKGLLNSIPNVGVRTKQRLEPIPGSVPDPFNLPKGCSFAPRCGRAVKACEELPPLQAVSDIHQVRCCNLG